jgi:hypothetical protein
MEQTVQNEPSLYISNITTAIWAVVTSPNHNLEVNDYVKFSSLTGGFAALNGLVGKILSVTTNTFTVDISTLAMGAYSTNGGLISKINQWSLLTKSYNPYFEKGKQVRASWLDFYMDRTESGSFTVDYFIDDYNTSVLTQTVATYKEYGIAGDPTRIWQRATPNLSGQFIQMRWYLSEDQIRTSTYQEAASARSDIIIHAINLWTIPVGRLQSYGIV